MSISVVIPNYNGENLLKKNLPKVFDAVNDVEVIVIDDASVDRSLEVLNNFKDKIKIIKNERNIGFSRSINRAVEEAKGEIVVLLNTDVVPEKDFLKPLLKHFEDKKVFAVGCMDKSVEDGKIILRGRGIGQWKRGFLVHDRGEVNKTNTLWVSGGSSAFRKSIWDKLRGFNPLLAPFYWEDIDISYRAIKSGYKIVFEPKSIVIHEHEKGAIKGEYSASQIKEIAYKNQFIFVWENADIDLILSHILWLPHHLAKALLSLDVAFYLGLLRAFLLLPKILKFRRKNRSLFIRKDKEVVQDFT
jgi:GT2 family glycosyltransferase